MGLAHPESETSLSGPLPIVAATPPRRHRGMFISLLVIVFLSGGVIGSGFGMIFAQRHFSNCLQHPERLPDRIVGMLTSELNLSPNQIPVIDEIVRRHHQSFETIRTEVHPRFAAVFDALDAEINQNLSAAQQTRWAEVHCRIRKAFPPSKLELKKTDVQDKQ